MIPKGLERWTPRTVAGVLQPFTGDGHANLGPTSHLRLSQPQFEGLVISNSHPIYNSTTTVDIMKA